MDATEAFFGLHRSKVLKKYKKLKIGAIKGEKPQYVLPQVGELSQVSGEALCESPAAAAGMQCFRYHLPSQHGSPKATKALTSTIRITACRRKFAVSSMSMWQVSANLSEFRRQYAYSLV